jgi:hypothetical protein
MSAHAICLPLSHPVHNSPLPPGLFFVSPQKVEIPAERKSVQKAVDSAIISKLDKTVTAYLRAKFTLTKGQYPHALTF